MHRTTRLDLQSFGRFFAALCVVAVLAGAREAQATSLLFDQIPGSGGKLSYNGEGGALSGINIVFQQITGTDTPLNDGDTLTLIDGKLNFITGDNITETPVWTWGGGGFFKLTADTVLDPSSNVLIAGNDIVLLTGTFEVNQYGYAAIALSFGSQLQISSFGIDHKHQAILDYYGLSPVNFVFASSEISATNLSVKANRGFTASVFEADITNTPIPEPSTAVLGAIAAASMLVLRRRLFKR